MLNGSTSTASSTNFKKQFVNYGGSEQQYKDLSLLNEYFKKKYSTLANVTTSNEDDGAPFHPDFHRLSSQISQASNLPIKEQQKTPSPPVENSQFWK